MPNTVFISLNQPANQIMVQLRTKAGICKARVITVQKIVKYCTYYKWDYHIEDKYYNKYIHLKKAKKTIVKPDTKQRKNRRSVKDEQMNNNLDKSSYLIQSKLRSFITILASSFLYKLWIRHTETFWYSTYDQKLFLNFWPLISFCPIDLEAIILQGIKNIGQKYKN